MDNNMFSVKEVVAAASAIYRKQGYIKKNAFIPEPEVIDGVAQPALQPNSVMLSRYYSNACSLEITDQDRTFADEVIAYLSGLSFKAMERGLTDFETNILRFVTSDQAPIKEVGIAASLPQVYDNKLKQDSWEQRERELSETSDYVGTLKQRSEFEVVVENTRYIGRTESYLYCVSVDDQHILKFFSQDKLGDAGTKLCLSGFVKSHTESQYHGGKETMINRVKVHSVNP